MKTTFSVNANSVTFIVEEDDSEQLKRILNHALPCALERFAGKNKEYGGRSAGALGIRGQFADIWRKIGKLKTAMWDGRPEQLVSESVAEVAEDLIGHLLLTLDMLANGEDA